jgi:hypothetical protein
VFLRYKEGEEVKAGGRYRFLYEDEESVALMIKKVELGDGGKYTVKATNEFGEVITEGNLFVRGTSQLILVKKKKKKKKKEKEETQMGSMT